MTSETETIVTILRHLGLTGSFNIHLDGEDAPLKPISSHIYKFTNIVKLANENIVIYLFQTHTSCDGLFIPKHNAFIGLRYNDMSSISEYISSIDKSHINEKCLSNSIFMGFLAENSRPSHFFYNMASIIPILPKRSHLIKIKDRNYLDFHDIYPEKEFIETNHSVHEINNITKQGAFTFRVGCHFNDLLKVYANSFDCRFINFLQKCSNSCSNISINKLEHNSVIWLGVTGQKRELCEQVEAYSLIIKECLKLNEKTIFIFDGWTSPLYKSRMDESQIQADKKIVDKILLLLERDNIKIDYIETIGMKSTEKVRIALHVDYFISNHGTGSMHVSRFAMKKGLTHLSNRMFDQFGTESIHHNVYRYPSHLTVDDVHNGRVDMTSYHVNPVEFSKYFVNLITKND